MIELKCRELGPVVFPAYVGTSVSVRARAVADGLTLDDEMTRRIRHSLARDAAAPSVPDDPVLRREVATALLYQRPGPPVLPSDQRPTRPAAPPATGHPAPDRSTGAPLSPEHPPTTSTDAPPSDGHPSTPENPRSARPQGYIRQVAEEMKRKLPPIEEDKD